MLASSKVLVWGEFGRTDELAMHPTVKPVALVADAIKDVSKRKGIVLDPFCGSDTTSLLRRRPASRPRYCVGEDVEAARAAANDSPVARKEVA